MITVPTKASLSPRRRPLLEMMQRINFGKIEQLRIAAGEPEFTPAPRVVCDIKLGAENGVRPELSLEDFALRASVVELLAQLDMVGTGTISTIEVRYGLPVRLLLERSPEELTR